MRPHSFVGMYDHGGTATIVGIALMILAVVLAIVLDARDGRTRDADPAGDGVGIEGDADLWTFP
jgi:hypothetical protein